MDDEQKVRIHIVTGKVETGQLRDEVAAVIAEPEFDPILPAGLLFDRSRLTVPA
jgi:hypothetical protein